MNPQILEKLAGVGFLVMMGMTVAFLVLVVARPGSRLWVLALPLAVAALYIPYEGYFAIPEVSLSVPIRVDLLALVPLFEVMFVLAARGWVTAARRYHRPIGFPMAVVMGMMAVAWPVYVAVYLVGIGF